MDSSILLKFAVRCPLLGGVDEEAVKEGEPGLRVIGDSQQQQVSKVAAWISPWVLGFWLRGIGVLWTPLAPCRHQITSRC